jgi:AcrR family transcriptional regulator
MPKPDVSVERKAQILAAASRIFLKKGFETARMEEIAEEAGLSIGGLYWYFKSKEEVIFSLMDELINSDLNEQRALLEAPGSVMERLTQYVRSSVPSAQTLSPLFSDFYALGGRDPRVQVRFQTYFYTYRQIIAALLAQGIARGEFRSFDVNHGAILFAALYEGMLELAMLDPENINGIIELSHSMDILMQGMKPDGGINAKTN